MAKILINKVFHTKLQNSLFLLFGPESVQTFTTAPDNVK